MNPKEIIAKGTSADEYHAYLAEIAENFIPPQIPNPKAIKEATSMIIPFLNPL